VAQISAELDIYVVTLYNWKKTLMAADKFTVLVEAAGLKRAEHSAYYRERGGCTRSR
jgi:hypothetical protein